MFTILFLPVLSVALAADATGGTRYPGAVEVFRCAFDATWDKDFDKWPDGWSRRRGTGFPGYVSIKVSQEPAPQGDHCLRVDLDGGGAVAYSPPVKVGPLLSHVLEGYVKTEGLKYDRAYFSVTLSDSAGQRLETFCSEKVQTTDGWQKVCLGPFSSAGSEARSAMIGLHVEPQSREDLRGVVRFADVRLSSLPRVALTTNDAHNFFIGPQPVEITCIISGFLDNDSRVVFQLEDALARPLAQVEQRLDGKQADSDDLFGGRPGMTATAGWKPPIPGPGFYRIAASVGGLEKSAYRQQLTLAVVEPRQASPGSEFGWSLPQGDKPLPLTDLSRLIGQAGIRRVKYPLWYDDSKDAAAEQLLAFAQDLGSQEIELVGLLSVPPRALQDQLSQAADIFTPEPKVWYPSLESVMARLAAQVRWWQLGDDNDTSFVGYPNLPAKIAQIKGQLDRIGQDLNVGMGWKWQAELPEAAGKRPPWRFLALSADPPLSERELAASLDRSKEARVERWVALEPLSRRAYPLEVRAADLVERMIAAKVHGAEGIFCPDPFSADRGLMNEDGAPGELLLPWRTTALMLGGSTYLGSVELPNGSPNCVFSRGNHAVMVVWNEKPTEETLYLGENVRQVDLWGRNSPCNRSAEDADHQQVIRVERLPTFVTGISEPIARWRIDFRFAQERLPSVFGRAQENSFRMKSSFADAVRGRVTLVVPDRWKVAPGQVSFRLAGGEELQQPIAVTFPYDADSGPQPVRADFEIQGERPCRFSVYRHIEVGLGDVRIEVATRLSDDGELEVAQRVVNRSDGPASFRCGLLAPDRRRLATQVLSPAQSSDEKVYRLADGRELLGKTLWLRAEEVNGPRRLNYRFTAEK